VSNVDRSNELARVRRQRWLVKNPDYHKKYRSTPEFKAKAKVARAARYLANKGTEQGQMKVWRENNKERKRELGRKWSKANPEKERLRLQNKRHRMVGTLSRGLASKLLALQRFSCAACRVDISKMAYEMDHIEPLKLGGLNVDSNIQLLCASCNSRKSAKEPHAFMQERGYLI
jgi:5-methylcytosine-specific restriction endonuclease McrA